MGYVETRDALHEAIFDNLYTKHHGGTYGVACKTVKCSNCGAQFHYAHGVRCEIIKNAYFTDDQSQVEATVQAEAGERLKQIGDKTFGFVPCPSCGQYQENMCDPKFLRHTQWLLAIGILGWGWAILMGCMLLVVLLYDAYISQFQIPRDYEPGIPRFMWLSVAGSAALGSMCLAIAHLLARLHDVHKKPIHVRREIARRFAVTADTATDSELERIYANALNDIEGEIANEFRSRVRGRAVFAVLIGLTLCSTAIGMHLFGKPKGGILVDVLVGGVAFVFFIAGAWNFYRYRKLIPTSVCS